MSSFLAVGAVSAVLRGLIEESVTRHDLATVLGGAPEVSALPPDRIPTGAGTPDRINLFLFQATENAAWRNMDLPGRSGAGDRMNDSRMALDLHYLVTAYGSADFRSEVLLGHAMHVFHETPVLTRQAIQDALAALSPGNLADALAAARLADQFEQIRIVPRVLNVEEVSKIWTALQSQYRTTAAYHASVVLVDAARPGRSALPVLTRGQPLPALAKDEGVFVSPGIEAPFPRLEALAMPSELAPAIRMGEALTLRGTRLDGASVRARFRLVRSTAALELEAEPGASATAFTVLMPPDPPAGPVPPDSPLNPGNWQAGIYEVTGIIEQDGVERETNRLPLALAPRIDSIAVVPPAGPATSLEASCSPPVRPNQEAALLVGNRALVPEPSSVALSNLAFDLPAPPEALAAGPYWVRLRIDGVESLVVDYAAEPPQFDASQSVSLP